MEHELITCSGQLKTSIIPIWTTATSLQMAHWLPAILSQSTLPAASRVTVLEHRSDHAQNPLEASRCSSHRELRGEGAR